MVSQPGRPPQNSVAFPPQDAAGPPQDAASPAQDAAGHVLCAVPLPDRAGLRLAGEADLASARRLREALLALPADGTIHLDLADLNFIDVACARELMALGRESPDRRLILHDPPLVLRRLMSLLWPEAAVEVRTRAPGQSGPGRFPSRR